MFHHVSAVFRKIQEASHSSHPLILLVAPFRSGKTQVLFEVSRELNIPVVNVNLELSRNLLELPRQKRARAVFPLLLQLLRKTPEDIALWDNIELLFEPQLKQDPLRCLFDLARHKTLLVSWPGRCQGGYLTYATPGHPEHRRYPLQGFLWVDLAKEKA